MLTTVLIIVNVFAALAIIVLALMQQSKGDMGSAFGGGGSQSMFGSRGSANFLSRMTALMCTVFFISSLWLAYVYAQRAESNSVVLDQSVLEQPVEAVETDSLSEELPTANDLPTADSELPAANMDAAVEDAVEAADEALESEVPPASDQ